MTDREWLADHGFECDGHGVWRRDDVTITLYTDEALCCIRGGWDDIRSVRVWDDTAELAVRRAVESLGEAHRRALAILEGA